MKEKKAQVFQRGDVREETIGLVKLPQRNMRQCIICSTKNSLKKSHFICVQCKTGFHRIRFDKRPCV